MTVSNGQHRPTTTDAGIPLPSDEHPLTIGPDGPILLQDHYLIEQMANPCNGVSKVVLDRAFEYWGNIDKAIGGKVEAAVRNGWA
jgi:hypothetical protein